MHRALESFDILSQVFQHVPSDSSQPFDRRQLNRHTLAQAVRVCKAFSDPALSVLWRHLPIPRPLYMLFMCLRNIQHDGDNATDGDIPQYDLARFQRYARRIRSIKYCPASMEVNNINYVYPFVARGLNVECLMPCLTSLHWEQDSADDTSITTLLSPSLRSLHLDFYLVSGGCERPIALEMLLQSIFQGCPSLQDVSMTSLYAPPKPFAFAALQRLRKVELLDCSLLVIWHVFQALSTVPTLVHLVLDIKNNNCNGGSYYYRNGFHALRTLTIFGELPCIQPIVSAISSTTIDSLHIATTQSARFVSEYADLLTIVASRWSISLCTLKLDLKLKGIGPGSLPNVALLKFLHPALTLGALTRLEIGTPYISLTIADEDMHTLASSYSCLEALRIQSGADLPRLQEPQDIRTFACGRPALSALLDLAHRMPALRDLTMPFVLDQAQLDTLAANPHVASRALRCLGADNSILEVAPGDLERVANCIIAAFPDLAILHFPEVVLYERKWRYVYDTILALGETVPGRKVACTRTWL
ncbi:hypothetical protein B0H21DRAFT_197184 [Amylocystis lapponica]|nr:hypothetical protein B0H21DRAFT_197184 [Amylocystis lapponica]